MMHPDEHSPTEQGTRRARTRVPPTASTVRAELRWSLLLLWVVVAVPSIGLGILILGPRLGTVSAGAVGLAIGAALVVPAARLSVRRLGSGGPSAGLPREDRDGPGPVPTEGSAR